VAGGTRRAADDVDRRVAGRKRPYARGFDGSRVRIDVPEASICGRFRIGRRSNRAMNRVRVKFCGITRLEDAQAAVSLGADAVGFLLTKKSKRFVEPSRARAMR